MAIERKANTMIELADALKSKMTVNEKIKFLNTPYKDMPPVLQPGMTRNPQKYNFVRMHQPHIGEQNDTFGVRLIRYRSKHHLGREEFCEICNEYAKKFDVKATASSRAVRTRITLHDLQNYEDYNVSPKIDKMTVICKATGMPMDYFAGYGPKYRRTKG